MKITSYKDLDVWKKGIEIVDFVYEITAKFPTIERFGLASHMQRTSVFIPSNIAEGFLRQHAKEYRQFLYISRGSCGELNTQAVVSRRRNYVNENDFNKLEDMLDHESRMLMNLIKTI